MIRQGNIYSLANRPGNVLLNKGEGKLPRQSIVNVTQVITANKSELAEYIGRLSRDRMRQVLRGIRLVLEAEDNADELLIRTNGTD